MKTLSKILILLLYTFLVTTTVFAQQSAILTYGSSAKSASTKSKITSIIGQPLVGESVDPVKFNYSLSLGFWGILRLP
ncbi:MAG: hypothetical protein K9I99_06225, partial [Melioribacteraceae bacterium]|nr:hypothetical protein [Melioribacteraceae bacterium]